MNSQIRILLIDDHVLFRESLGRLIEADPRFRVVGQTGSVSDAIKIVSDETVDVALLDYDLGEESGIGFIEDVRLRKLPVKILMVTAGMGDRGTLSVLNGGALGILLKHSSPSQLVDAIHKVANGEVWLDGGAIRSLIAGANERSTNSGSTRPLTPRQSEVLRSILDGLTNKEIAWKLKSSESSVKAVLQELFHKAGVRTRSQLVKVAIEKHSYDWLNRNS
jgi:two-component system, NarL family, nitrate/nitrite response regulator NarL